jgi:hypothetical protein
MTLPEKYRADRLNDAYTANLRLMSPWQLRALRVQVNGAVVSIGLIDHELEQHQIARQEMSARLVKGVSDILEGVKNGI